MKKQVIRYIVWSILFWSCNKQLDLAPEDTLVERDVFKTEAGAEQVLAEAYYNFFRAVTGGIAYVYGDFTTSNLQHSVYYDTWDKGDVSPTDEAVKSIWQNYYAAINAANNIILNIPVYGQFAAAKQSQFLAEARFIRAYAYLDLLKFFGDGALRGGMNNLGVPLQLTPFKGYNTGEVIPRSTNVEVYQQIINDLQESLVSLPEKHSNELKTRSRATTGAAYALLARAYLYMKDYAQVADAAKKVIESTSIYSLTSDLKQLFPANPIGSPQNFTAEYILGLPVSQMVSSSTGANNNLGNSFFYKRSFWIPREFMDAFNPGDLRVSLLMFKGDTIYNTDRFKDQTTFKFNNPNGRDNVPLIRLAEVMLMRAEALSKTTGVTNESVLLLNAVRSRSQPTSAPYDVQSFATAEQLTEKIWEERRFELAFEGFYRYDLIRTNQPLRIPDIPESKKVLPIPQIEIDISGGLIRQNPGF